MAIRFAIIAASILLSTPNLALANTVNSQALDLASDQKYSQALDLLSQQSQLEQSSYEHRFLKVRILSWDGQYPEAHLELESLMTSHPGNPDLHFALGNLEFYQGNLDAAEKEYERVLAQAPNYTDAQNGLANVQKARESQPSSNKKTWRIDGGLGVSDFDNSEIPEWNDQFFRVEYSPHSLSYHGSAQRYRRFGSTDIQIQAGISDAVRGGWDWGLEVGATPAADFRPELSLGGRLGIAFNLESGLVLYPNINVRHDKYEAGSIKTVQPDLTAYFENGTVLTGRLIGTFQGGEDDQLGWLVEARKSITDQLKIRAGYARAPEAIDGLAITTKSFFGGLTYSLTDDLDIHLNLSRDDREESFVRDSANVSFTYKR